MRTALLTALALLLLHFSTLAAASAAETGRRFPKAVVDRDEEGYPPDPFSYTHCESLLGTQETAVSLDQIQGYARLLQPATSDDLTEKAWSLFNLNRRSRQSRWWHVELTHNKDFKIVRANGSVAYERNLANAPVYDRELVEGPDIASLAPYAILEERDGIRIILELANWQGQGMFTLAIDVPREQVAEYLTDEFFVETAEYPKIISGDKEYYRIQVLNLYPDRRDGKPWWKDREPRRPSKAPGTGHLKPIIT